MLDLAKSEIKGRSQVLIILPVSWQVAPLRPSLVFQELEAGLTKFSAQLVLRLHEIVLCEVSYAKRVARVGLKSPLEVLHGLLPHLIVVYIR